MIQSVRKQTYSNWELCIANADPKDQEVKEILKTASAKDVRIKVTEVPENEGIAQNTNAALKMASGEYIGLLDHDDLLTPDALYEVVRTLNEEERTQVRVRPVFHQNTFVITKLRNLTFFSLAAQ